MGYLCPADKSKIIFSQSICIKFTCYSIGRADTSLDVKSEQMLYHRIHREMKDKTVIFVSHRITSAAQADKILVVDKGIVEMGTHET